MQYQNNYESGMSAHEKRRLCIVALCTCDATPLTPFILFDQRLGSSGAQGRFERARTAQACKDNSGGKGASMREGGVRRVR
jgi:hypothetical protein